MIKKAIVRAYDSATHTATVQIEGSMDTWLEDIPVSRGIADVEMVTGRHCAVIMFNEANPKDAVIVGVFP